MCFDICTHWHTCEHWGSWAASCSLWCNTAAREIVVDVGTSPAGFRPCVAQRIAQLRGECRQCRHAVLGEELAHRRALRRRSGDQVSQLTEEITQRWMLPKRRGGWEVVSCLRAEIYTSKKNILRDSFCRVFVQSLSVTWLFSSYLLASTCIYLHLLAHIYTLHTHHITSHHITSHLHYLTKCFRNSLQFGRLFGFPLLPVFPCYLQRIGCSIFHLARCFHCFWHLVSRFARYLRYFGTWTLDFAFWNFNLSFGAIFTAFHHQNNTNNCGLLVVLAILCCCGCGYRACFLWFLLFLLFLLLLLFLLVCGCCCACGCGSGCSCGWWTGNIWTEPNRIGPVPRRSFFRPENRVYPAANEHCYGKWPCIDGFSIQKRLAFYVLARNTSKYHAAVCLLTPAGNAIAHAVAQSSSPTVLAKLQGLSWSGWNKQTEGTCPL